MRHVDFPRRAWLVWGVGVLAYAVAVLQRSSLGVAATYATERFGIGASAFSTFVVLQLVMYAAMQVPVGVLVDRYGPRVLVTIGALVMAGGQVLMATSTETSGAVVARMLVGTGDAMTFVSVLRLVPSWFPARRVPVLTQVTGLLGQLGQVASTIPLVLVLGAYGWTPAYLGAAGVGVVVAVAVVLTVRDSPLGRSAVPPVSFREAATQLRLSFAEPGTRLGLWSHFTSQFSQMVFVLLWGFPFLTVGLGYSPALAGTLLTMMVLSGLVVAPVLGQLTAAYPFRRSNLVLTVSIATVVAWTVVLLWPGAAPLPVVVLLLLVLSANGPASAVGFDFARSFNPTPRLGVASGIVNVGGFTASLLTILVVGLVLDLRSPSGAYDLGDFKLAFCFQYLPWAFGFWSLVRSRRLTRAGLAAQGSVIDPLPRAIARHWHDRGQR
ncbi:Sugar phosphate permease [Microlunatus sagamiharensis]|uniref:Sugar phosphate permease n=1 Tax=Microlunatus sagamiharensis TaxID=546874 RepID=A0A1H2LXM0_9ACTN|nr:Sugar phosphate permease [Microlunatus sagamiharensis]